MSQLHSSVLIIGHPDPSLISFGADFASSMEEATSMNLLEKSYSLIAFEMDGKDHLRQIHFLRQVQESSPRTRFILVVGDAQRDLVSELSCHGSLFKVLPSFLSHEFEESIRKGLEQEALFQQNRELLHLIVDRNRTLEENAIKLQRRIDKRSTYLAKATDRLLRTNQQMEHLHQALMAIHEAGSTSEVESSIYKVLGRTFDLAWIRILRGVHPEMESEMRGDLKSKTVFSAPLLGESRKGKEQVGQIYFAREKPMEFTQEEDHFFLQISEAVALAVDRIEKLAMVERLKHQWEATFDAISRPVSLVSSDYILIRTNRAFAQRVGRSAREIIGKHCYNVFLGRSDPCVGCHLGKNFQLNVAAEGESDSLVFEVLSHRVDQGEKKQKTYVHLYEDVTLKRELEAQMIDSAKMGELGVIGSSIAHELNNPLGGMIAFLHLVRGDVSSDSPLLKEISELEHGARRCKEIIEDLLGFSRVSTGKQLDMVEIGHALDRAVRIVELQTRARGIVIDVERLEDEVFVAATANLLSQLFYHVLDLMVSLIEDPPVLHVSLRFEESLVTVDFVVRTGSEDSISIHLPETLVEMVEFLGGQIESQASPFKENRSSICKSQVGVSVRLPLAPRWSEEGT